jgi:predicted ATP-grasp superfamily ATP-dependent carboligase
MQRILMSVYPDFDTAVPVLVLKIGRCPVHHGTLGIIRSLGSMGIPVYAMVDDYFAPAAVSRYLTGAFKWNTGDVDAEQLLAGLAIIGKRLRRRAILIPTDDAAAIFIAEQAEGLANQFLFSHVKADLPRRLTNKKDLYYLCRSSGVPCPEAAFPRSIDDVHEFIGRATFPVVVKAAESRRLPQTARPTHIAGGPAELLTIYLRLECPDKPNLIFQEYIPESSSEDWIFHGYSNPESNCLVSFTGRKLRSWPPFAGITTLGVSVLNEPLRQQTVKLVNAVGYAGIMDIDYRLDKRDGQYKLLDFNPRIGANFRMFEDRGGLDVVRALHLDLTERCIRPLPAVEGRTFIVESFDLFAALVYMRRGGLTLQAWKQSLRGSRGFAWFAWRDPIPFLTMWVWLALQTMEHAVQRLWAGIRQRTGQGRISQQATTGGHSIPPRSDPPARNRVVEPGSES